MIRYRCVNESGITRLQNFKDNDTEKDPYYYTEIQYQFLYNDGNAHKKSS